MFWRMPGSEKHWSVYTAPLLAQSFMANLDDLFCIPENDFETGEELVEILGKEGIKNPLTNKPIILEDSPVNIILETDGDGFRIKLCLENGSFLNLF